MKRATWVTMDLKNDLSSRLSEAIPDTVKLCRINRRGNRSAFVSGMDEAFDSIRSVLGRSGVNDALVAAAAADHQNIGDGLQQRNRQVDLGGHA